MKGPLEFPRDRWVDQLVRQSIAEDVGSGDASTDVTVASGTQARALVVPRARGVCAGLPLLGRVYAELSADVKVRLLAREGQEVGAGSPVAEIRGPAGPILTGERTALNFLQHLGGIASRTAEAVAEVAGTRCMILDTRKTLPGYRALAKYAVRCGGGQNHRLGLYDRIMLKDNHWAARRTGIAALVARCRQMYPQLAVEIEVDTLQQLQTVLPLGVEWVLLDNFSLAETRQAVAMRDDLGSATRLEGSGNMRAGHLAAYAATGLDAISMGALTHSVTAWDLGMDFVEGVAEE